MFEETFVAQELERIIPHQNDRIFPCAAEPGDCDCGVERQREAVMALIKSIVQDVEKGTTNATR